MIHQHFHFAYLSLCILSVFWLAEAPLHADEVVRNRFLKEAPEQWLEYRKFITRHTAGTVSWNYYQNLSEKKLAYGFKGSFFLNMDQGSIFYRSEGQKTGGKLEIGISAFNPRYFFKITQAHGDKWKIRKVDEEPLPIPDDLIGRHNSMPIPTGGEFSSFGMHEACLGQKLFDGWLPLIVASPDFTLIEAEYAGDNDQYVQVTYSFEPKQRPAGGTPSRGGVVVLDPSRFWQVREANMEAIYFVGHDIQGTLKIANQFSEFDDGAMKVPYVSHQVMHISQPESKDNPPQENDWLTDVTLRSDTDIDPTKFTLSAYGLPEPIISQQSRPWLLWLGLALLLLCVALVVGIRWWKERNQIQ